jgi:ligand-binding sensor domain-containing protein/two-component sensor histidine kinase
MLSKNIIYFKMKRLLTTLILIFILSRIAYADDYTFKQLTESDGLSQSTVFAIMQDTHGYLWFGTIEGLNRYDGYNFRIYVNSPDDSTSISDDLISTIFEDSENNIWVGTRNGYFNKFDRETESFKRFNVNDYFEMLEKPEKDYYEYPLAFSRNHNYSITSIIEDGDNFLWIGTWGNGLLRFDKKNETALHFYNLPDFHLSLSNNRIMNILIDREKTVWIATFGGGLNRVISNPDLNQSSTELSKYNLLFFSYRNKKNNNYSLSDDKVISLFEDKDETIWIGTYDGGLNKLDRTNRSLSPSEIKFSRYVTLENTDNCICNNTVMDIAQDYDGYLWIGTFGGGIDRLDIEAESFRHYYSSPVNLKLLPDNEILSLLVDNSGILWVGAHLGDGITKIQKNTAKFKYLKSEPGNSQSLNDNIVWAIHKDYNNTLWVGTYRGGLNFIDQNNNKSAAYQFDVDDPSSISNNHIRAIEEDNFNNLWIGTYNGGINRFKPKKGKFDRFLYDPDNPNSLSANQVQDIFIESDTTIWVATFGGGLNKLSFKTNSSDEFPEFTVYENDPSDSTTITDDRVYVLYEDSKKNFWIGTYGGGLNKFNRNTEIFTSFKNNPDDPSSISNDKIIAIQEDSNEILWIGTSGGGLNKFNSDTKKFTRYSYGDGLTSAVVYGILEDNSHNIWMSSDDGIFRMEPGEEKFTYFGLEDGLQSLEFSGGAYLKDETEKMYFGGINGLIYFFPDSIGTNLFVPPIVITSINVFTNRIKGETEEIILSYDQNFISFEFSALDYTNSKENQYAFMLEGLDDSWKYVDADHRIANYINLPAGEYSFHVMGTNSDGLWNKRGTSIKLIITPPFWLTWWFITLMTLLLGMILYYLSTNRIKHQLAIEKLKTKLAADLHDNVGASLTEISILSEVAVQKSNDEGNPKELKNISEIARQLIDTMSDIVFVVNPERDSLYDLIIKLKDSYNDFLNSVGISFKVKNIDKTNDIKLPMDYKQNLLLIFKEGINNSIKHSKCSKIILEANIRADVVEMILNDDGNGFDEKNMIFGNGLRNMESRAKKIGGRMTWRSSQETGTVIIFIGKIDRFSKLKFLLNR